MEQRAYAPEILDLRRQSGVWERVGPQMPPYQEEEIRGGNRQEQVALQPVESVIRQEAALPGAELNPCCMGSAAAELTAVITGFGEDELTECRHLQALSHQAPAWAAGQLRELAVQHAGQAKRLFAVYYLITGSCYTPLVQTERIYVGRWCPALRERYHAAACNGLNYERAADSTTDVCLRKLLQELGAMSYRQAEMLLRMLERSMNCG